MLQLNSRKFSCLHSPFYAIFQLKIFTHVVFLSDSLQTLFSTHFIQKTFPLEWREWREWSCSTSLVSLEVNAPIRNCTAQKDKQWALTWDTNLGSYWCLDCYSCPHMPLSSGKLWLTFMMSRAEIRMMAAECSEKNLYMLRHTCV